MRRVDHRSGALPPGSVDHGDEAVERMIMRVAEAVGLELVDIDIQAARLLGVAVKDGAVGGCRSGPPM